MINTNMIHLAATAHQRELHRAAAEQRSAANHSSEAVPSSRRAVRVLTRMLRAGAGAGRRARRGNAVPRLSI